MTSRTPDPRTPDHSPDLARTPATPAEPVSTSARSAFFDNAKIAAVVLVVCGHAWGPLAGTEFRPIRAAYLLVYLFHMPLFVAICGYLSRSFARNPADPQRWRRLVLSTLVPYAIFGTLYPLFRNVLAGENPVDGPWTPLQPLQPWYLTWFLVALFIWRVTAPIWRLVRWPLAVSVVASLAVGATQPRDLALGQVIQFLPFFVLGLTIRPELLDRLHRIPWRRTIAAVVFAAALAGCYLVAPDTRAEWLYRRSGHESLDVGIVHWWLHSAAQAAIALLLCVAFLAVVPTRRHRWTKLGEGSLYTYLLHGFVIQAALAWGFYELLKRAPGTPVLVTVLAVGLALVLALPPVRRAMRWLVEPRLSWLFPPPATETAHRRQ